MSQKKIITKLQDDIKTTEKNLQVSNAERDAYQKQNKALEQKMEHFETDYKEKMHGVSILEYIWERTLRETEKCIIWDWGRDESEIEKTRNKIVQATNFAEHLYKMLCSWCYEYFIDDNAPFLQYQCLQHLRNCVDFQITKLQAFIHKQEFIQMDREKTNELMAKFLFVWCYMDVILLISKFGFTDKFYHEFHKKVAGLYLVTPIRSRQDITEEKEPLSIIYKNLIYQELDPIISKLSKKNSNFAFEETSRLMDKLQAKFMYQNKENEFSSIYHQFQDYIDINNLKHISKQHPHFSV